MKKVICYQLELGKYNFAVISTKCSSFHQGESEEVRTSNHELPVLHPGDWRHGWRKHQDVCERGMMEKSAVVEHAWENHPIHWEETTVLDHGMGQELLALHIQMTPPDDTSRGALQLRWRTAKSLVAGPLWWGGNEEGAILTDLWPPMTWSR